MTTGYWQKIVVLGMVAALGCGQPARPTDAADLSQQQFIELMVALRNAQNSARSKTELETMKQAIFRRARVTPEELNKFIALHGRDLEFMAAAWDSVRARLEAAPEITPR